MRGSGARPSARSRSSRSCLAEAAREPVARQRGDVAERVAPMAASASSVSAASHGDDPHRQRGERGLERGGIGDEALAPGAREPARAARGRRGSDERGEAHARAARAQATRAMRSRPPKSFRLPETSSTSASGSSSATLGVNCAAQPASPSRPRSPRPDRAAGRRARARARAPRRRRCPGARRAPAALPSQATTRWLRRLGDRLRLRRGKARVSASSGRLGRYSAIHAARGAPMSIDDRPLADRAAALEDPHREPAGGGIAARGAAPPATLRRRRAARGRAPSSARVLLGGELQAPELRRTSPRRARRAPRRRRRSASACSAAHSASRAERVLTIRTCASAMPAAASAGA